MNQLTYLLTGKPHPVPSYTPPKPPAKRVVREVSGATMKVCKDCGEDKSVSDFYLSRVNKFGEGIYSPYCKYCAQVRRTELRRKL